MTGIVFFAVLTTCMIVGMVILLLLDKPFHTASYTVGVFSATIAAVATRWINT